MQLARIVMGSDVLSRSAAGGVYGNLSLQLNGLNFPEAQWTDFVVVVLCWWCRAAFQLLQGQTESAELRFMEGPFLVELRVSTPDTWHISLVEAGLTRRIRDSAEVKANPLVQSIVEASERAIAACRRQGWSSSDIDDLGSAVATLRQVKLGPQGS